MASKLSLMSTQIAANAAAVATAIAGGVSTADATALADLLKTLSLRPDLAVPAIALGSSGNTSLVVG